MTTESLLTHLTRLSLFRFGKESYLSL